MEMCIAQKRVKNRGRQDEFSTKVCKKLPSVGKSIVRTDGR